MTDENGSERTEAAQHTGATRPEGRRSRPASRLAAAEPVADSALVSEVPSDAEAPAAVVEVLAPGTKVGRYEVIRLVGQGGMGTVYEALDARLNRKVALKILASSLKSKRKAAKRFSIEAQAAARLVHPNVVGIFDFDVECEIPYMAMEFLQGETLAAVIARGQLAIDRMADIMLAVCAGVHAAHQAGIVHRDLKPSNIFLCPDWKGNEAARVLDFGISKVGGVSGSGLTQTGDIVGTSQYLSPEQAASQRHITAASDQYSLGVVMYECLTRQTPQRGEPIYSLLRNVTEGRHIPAQELRADLPPALDAIIERAMRVRPKDRFSSTYELGRALFPFASEEVRRQFDDFYNRTESGARRSDSFGIRRPSSQTEVDARASATRPLPREPTPTWQQRTTHTSARPSGQRRGAGAAPLQRELPSSSRSPSRARSVLLSIALGALLAVAALLVMGLIVRP
jgi:serine/threonine-protein kinase